MNKEEIKKKIEMLEYGGNGLKYINGADVQVRNLRITKTKATADIIIYSDLGHSERFDGCEYDLVKLGWNE
jgi:hypothetical protein